MRTRLFVIVVITLQTILGSVGCGKKEDKSITNDLAMLTIAYQSALDDNAVPPTKADDLRKRMGGFDESHFARYTIIYGIDPHDFKDAGNTVLIYEVGAPENGGYIAFVDGTVRRVTADEFGKLPKAVALPSISERKPDFSLSVEEYLADFERGGGSALLGGKGLTEAKYRGKLIEVKGGIWGFKHGGGNDDIRTLALGTYGKSNYVACYLTDPLPWERYGRGQMVTVRGIGPHDQAYPHLLACTVTEVGPDNRGVLTAEQLATESDADREAFEKKYKNKSFVVTGEVARHEGNNSFRKLYLKGPGKRLITCAFDRSSTTRAKVPNLNPGDKVKVYGVLNPYGSGEAGALEECELFTK